MKKIVSILSATAIVMTACVPAVLAETTGEVAAIKATEVTLAASERDVKELLESVKQRIEIPEEYTEFKSENTERGNVLFYTFSWNKPDKSGENILVQCTSDGVITSYYKTQYKDVNIKTPYISKVTPTDAKRTADEFIKSIIPSDFPYEIVAEDNERYNLYSTNYSFTINMYANGILFNDGTGRITIDKTTGEVREFSVEYMPIEFPSVDNALTKEEAQRAYGDKLGLKLVYESYTDDDDNIVVYPSYVQKYSYNKYIHALTGEVFDNDAKLLKYDGTGSGLLAENAAADEESMLRTWEIEELETVSGLISKNEIEKQIRDNTILSIPKEAVVTDISLMKTEYNNVAEYTYGINMSVEDEINIHMSVNAQTGVIKNYGRYEYNKKDSKITYQNDDAFKTLAGDISSEYRYDEEIHSYVRYVNDIPVSENRANVVYTDGVLTNYYISYYDVDFPSIDNAISVSEAEEKMFEQCPYNIEYILNYENNTYTAVPVFTLRGFTRMNPFSGELIDYKNVPISESTEKLEYSDVDGHYAESIINELARYGVGFEGGVFEPNSKITQKDFLTLLMSTYQSGVVVLRANKEQTDYVYGRTIARNIISEEERDDDKIITREDAAVYMIRAMGAEDYAKYNDIYVTPFNDVTQNKGYVALLSAMGIVNGDGNGNFNPDSELTRAESAVMIHNALTR